MVEAHANGNGNGNGTRATLPWRAAGVLGSSATGSGIVLALRGATPLEIVAVLAIYGWTSAGLMVGYAARQWIERKVRHGQDFPEIQRIYEAQLRELHQYYADRIAEIQAAARKRELELEADRDYLRRALGQAANLTATAVTTVVQKGVPQERGKE